MAASCEVSLAFLHFYIHRHRRQNGIVSLLAKGGLPPRSVGNNIAPFPHPVRVMNQYGDNPNLSVGASDGVGGEKSHLDTALHISAPRPLYVVRTTTQTMHVRCPGRYISPSCAKARDRTHTGPEHTCDAPDEQVQPARGNHSPLGHDLATQQEVDGDGSGVVQRQDAGHVPSESGEVLLRDIPPTYDSIVQ
jgi:hypothetical protein